MSGRTEKEVPDTGETEPSEFYERRYAPQRQDLQDMIFREVYDDYFGQSSLTSTANYDRFNRWLDVTPDSCVA